MMHDEQPFEEPVDELESEVMAEAIDPYAGRFHSFASMIQTLHERLQTKKPTEGCPSGNRDIDRLLGGFRVGRVTVLGAETSWGKSSFAILTANATLNRSKRVLLISAEDSQMTYAERFAASRMRISAIGLRDNNLRPNDVGLIDTLRMQTQYATADFFLDAIGKPVEWIAEAIKHNAELLGPAPLVIVDYLQAISAKTKQQDRRNEVSYVGRVLTDTIKSVGSSGLLLSQLKRPDGKGKPTMHDLKESGDIENSAEHVLIGYLEAGARFIDVAKNKDGPRISESIELGFNPETASFHIDPIYESQS